MCVVNSFSRSHWHEKLFSTCVVLLTAANLAGCANMSKQDVGTVSGGILGGLVGSQFGKGSGQLVAVGAGALAGAYLGGAIGKNMDETDRLKMSQALESNPVGQPAYWQTKKQAPAIRSSRQRMSP